MAQFAFWLSSSRSPCGRNRRRRSTNFASHFNRLRAFKARRRKYSCFVFSESVPLFVPSRLDQRDVRPIVRKREAGCDGRFGLSKDEGRQKRTAKARGPDSPTLESSRPVTNRSAMVAREPGTPGRAR